MAHAVRRIEGVFRPERKSRQIKGLLDERSTVPFDILFKHPGYWLLFLVFLANLVYTKK